MEPQNITYEPPLLPAWASVALTGAATALLLWSSWNLWQRQQHQPVPQQVWVLSQVHEPAYIAVEMTAAGPLVATAALQLPATQEARATLSPPQPKIPPVHQSTAELAGHVVRSLIREEVDSFMQRAQLFTEVSRHLAEQEY